MPWSTADARPAEPVLGDPASLAALGSALQRAAAELRELLGALEGESRPHTGSGSTRDTTARLHGTRLRELRVRGDALTAAMDLAGRRVTEHASELGDALALARRIGERARATGLVVDGGTVIGPAGVRGVADAGAERERRESAARLQRVLDTVLLDLDTARRALRRDLEEARARCARG
ncbi:hypothetical protein GA707_16635 [Nostocoides sp. F2B08]|uniref:hypothetical protein n=1 Tax=Nostocoides sp. F2B08 TaxID=2653936 RepID=UPI0012637042|nr:hypothetical protein [Tetrasphaera sp. F2B08]KAB7741842.1 hypothetical protein GA707_16635 [Tetrasphaera sp. F2B08]